MAVQSFPWNTVNTLVGDFVAPNARRQIYQSNALLNRLNARKKSYPGGREIQQPLVWKQDGLGQWFTGADILNTAITDTVQMAKTTPKGFAIPMVIAKTDEWTVRGKNAIMSLAELKGEEVMATAKHIMAGDLYNDGTDQMKLTGLQYIFKDFTGTAPGVLPAQTYCGIARQGRYDGSGGGTQTNNWWIHAGDDTAYTDVAGGGGGFDPLQPGAVMSTLGKMWATIQLQAGANRTPTLILSNVGAFTVYTNMGFLNDRNLRPQMDGKAFEAGYDNAKYKRAVWMVDEKCPRSSAKVEKIYFINEDTLRLFVHPEADFSFEPFRKPHNQMARVGYILWYGELMCIEPRCNGVMSSVSVATYS
jgi:hypothetical protein